MPTLSYSNPAFVTLTRISSTVMNAFFTDITTWANTTKLDYLNLQNQGVRAVNISSQAATSTQVLQADGAGAAAFVTRGKVNVVAKVATYGVLVTDEMLTASGTSFTFTLPAASSAGQGKSFTFKKTDATAGGANLFTIARAGSDTIDGATSVILATQYETITLVSDGSATYNILSRSNTTPWTAFPMVITGTVGNPTKATTPTYDTALWRRVGDSIEIKYDYATTATTGAAAGSGAYLFALPLSLTADSTKITAATTGYSAICGVMLASLITGPSFAAGSAYLYNSTNIMLSTGGIGAAARIGSGNVAIDNANLATYTFNAKIPITNWS